MTHRPDAQASGCLVCEAWALGDLCPRCEAAAQREPPKRLEKRTPPKGER